MALTPAQIRAIASGDSASLAALLLLGSELPSNLASYILDANSNVTGLLNPKGAPIGFAKGSFTYLRRLERNAYVNNGSLIQTPAWAATTAYSTPVATSQAHPSLARLAGGQIVGVQVAGTSGSVAPTFSSTTLMPGDGGVTWVYTGHQSMAAPANVEVPTINVQTATPGGLTATVFASGSSTFAGLTTVSWPTTPFNGTNPAYFYASNQAGTYATVSRFYNNGTNTSYNGDTAGLVNNVQMFEFITDCPNPAIVGATYGGNWRIFVGEPDGSNMYQVEESPTFAPGHGGGGTTFYQMTWPSGRKFRRYRVEPSGGSNGYFGGYAVDSQSIVVPIPQVDGVRGLWISDSFGNTETPGDSFVTLGIEAQRLAGIRYTQLLAGAGAGYVSGSTTWGSTSNSPQMPLFFQANNAQLAPAIGASAYWQPNVVIWSMGYNDWVSSPSLVAANAFFCWQQTRILYPNALIIIFGGCIGAHNGGSNEPAVEAALQSMFATWGDPYSAFQSIYLDPTGAWESGTGCLGATTGTGNSDFYTGTDTTHPTPLGRQYLARRMAYYIDLIMAQFGI